MATGGVREVGVRLKVGADGVDSIARLGESLKTLGVDTAELDRKADELSAQLVETGASGAKAAIDQGKLAEASAEAGKAADQLAVAAKDAAGGTGALGETGASAAEQLGKMKLELAAAGAAVYTIGRVLGGAAKDAAGFESAMAEVATLVDDTSGIDDQAAAVRRLALEYGGDAQSQAKALYQIISAGAEQGAQAIGVLDQANKLAVGGVTDITTAADGLTSILNAYGAQAGTAAQVSDALFVAMKAGKTTVGELSGSIGQVAPLAATAGVGLEQLLAAVAALTKGGVSTTESMTQLRGIISSVVKPTKEAADLAESLGIQFNVAALRSQGLAGFLDQVRKATGGNTEQMAVLFGQVEALGGVLSLTGNQAQSFGTILEQMAQRTGATDEAVAKIAGTAGFAGQQFQAALADARIALGQAVTAFTPLLRAATDLIGLFNSLPGPVQAGAAGIVALGAAVVPLTLAIGSLSKAAGLAATALGLKAGAAAAVVAPAAAAAAATATLGTAAAVAAPKIGLAATATTLLARAMSLLKAALPIGLVLAVAELATEFFRAKKGAEDADKAVRNMLEAPVSPTIPREAKAAADATADLGTAAGKAAAKLGQAGEAAVIAGDQLGLGMKARLEGATGSFDAMSQRLDVLLKGLGDLERQGVDTGDLVAEALRKMLAAAKDTADFDRLREKVVELEKAFTLSKTQAVELMQAIEAGARKAVVELSEMDKALRTFGLQTTAETKRIADEMRKAWALIRDDAKIALADKQAAFTKYAEAAIKANGGVADSTLQAEAKALKLEVAFDNAGKAVVRAAETGKPALADLKRSTDAATDAAINLGKGWQEANKAWSAYVDSKRLSDTAGDAIRATPSGGTTRTVETGQAVNKPPGEGWYYTTDRYKIRTPGQDANGRPLPGGWARDDSTVTITDPRAGITPAGSRSGTSPFGSVRARQQLEMQAALATQAAAAATPSQVVEIRFPRAGGGYIPAQVSSPQLAQELSDLLRDEYERRGS